MPKRKFNITPKIPIIATWTGYSQLYIQNIVKASLKTLKMLCNLTFDQKLIFWVEGLKTHLENKLKESEENKQG